MTQTRVPRCLAAARWPCRTGSLLPSLARRTSWLGTAWVLMPGRLHRRLPTGSASSRDSVRPARSRPSWPGGRKRQLQRQLAVFSWWLVSHAETAGFEATPPIVVVAGAVNVGFCGVILPNIRLPISDCTNTGHTSSTIFAENAGIVYQPAPRTVSGLSACGTGSRAGPNHRFWPTRPPGSPAADVS